jgi:hypothetical protein
MSAKENRYRFLLELYPADFRRQYADEMLGVLMADPSPVRKHAGSLLVGALAARIRQTLGGPDWRRAAAVVQLFGATLLFGLALRRLLMDHATAILHDSPWVPPLNLPDVVRVVIWAVLIATTLAGLRGLNVAAALAGLIAEVAVASRGYSDAPLTFLNDFRIVMGAAVVLVASTVPARGPGPRPPRPRGWLFVGAAGVVLAGTAVVSRPVPGYFEVLSLFRRTGPYFGITPVLLLVAGALAAIAVFRLQPPVRRRVIVSAVPVAVVIPVVAYGFGGLLDFNARHPDAVRRLGPVQWAALIVIPAVAFWFAARLNARLEHSRAATAPVVSAERRPEI